jgi:ATP-dependent DNA helicase RecQ
LEYLSALLPTLPGSGIIYTATRNNAEMVAAFLRAQNIDAIHYHAGIEDSMRQEIEQLWMANTYKVICSTNALGMGIHKPDIAFVIHYQLPASPINYYQEIGRAGRDGSAARCILLYDPEDKTIQEHFIQQAKPDQQHYSAVIDALRCEPMGMGRNDILRLTGLSQTTLKKILSDLEEQGFVKHFIHRKVRKYAYIFTLRQPDQSNNEQLRSQKEQELQDIINYANNNTCLMRYLTTYLGDHEENDCHVCSKCNAQSSPPIAIHASIRQSVALFLREGFLPHIEKRGSEKKPIHEAGWSLSYHGSSPLGKQVRASKYEGAGDFSAELVVQAVKILRAHYPLEKVSGIVSIPSTTSGSLVETFARSIANTLQIEYIPALKKTRRTGEQKNFSNWIQKAANIEGAFAISNPGRINKRTLLCIDDIYDSGYTMREAGQTLMQAGALAVYPFTITRTQHSDDQ